MAHLQFTPGWPGPTQDEASKEDQRSFDETVGPDPSQRDKNVVLPRVSFPVRTYVTIKMMDKRAAYVGGM